MLSHDSFVGLLFYVKRTYIMEIYCQELRGNMVSTIILFVWYVDVQIFMLKL